MMTGDEEKVTPYVGVWIETAIEARVIAWVASLLMWECGLKRNKMEEEQDALDVTPYVGVWIETLRGWRYL